MVANAKTFTMIDQFFGPGLCENKVVVKDGESLSLGKHTLTFVFAPMVHWPEVMVTYDSTDKVLFSADGFGKFGALDVDAPWDDEARRYYETAVQMDPGNAEYQRALDMINGNGAAYRPNGYGHVSTGSCAGDNCTSLCAACACMNCLFGGGGYYFCC